MLIDLAHARCRSCGSALQITGADDASIELSCTSCTDSYEIQSDALGDSLLTYWFEMMANRVDERGDEQ